MTPNHPHAIAARIARHAEALGWTVARHDSGLSASSYIECTLYGDDDIVDSLKIRVSDHELPPTYGALNGYADYEVGPHGDGHVDGWAGIVKALAERAGKPLPAAVKAAYSRIAKEKAAAEARWAAETARREAANAHADRVTAIMIERGLNHLVGKARKRARAKINAEIAGRDGRYQYSKVDGGEQ